MGEESNKEIKNSGSPIAASLSFWEHTEGPANQQSPKCHGQTKAAVES